MKERITLEQFKELTIDQAIKLKKLWQPKMYDVIMVSDKTYAVNDFHFKTVTILEENCGFLKEFCMPLLSIGQCLEILEQNFSCVSICIIPEVKEKFCLHLWKNESDYETEPLMIYSENDIDALWEGVKLVLQSP